MQNADLTEKSGTLKSISFFFFIHKNGKETFEDIEIEKNGFYHHKTPIFLKDVDIQKVLISNKISFGETNYKYFIGYLHNDNKVKPLHISQC